MPASGLSSSKLLGACFLVTGSARGIGKAIAEYLCQCGARVVITDLPSNQESLRDFAKSEGILEGPVGDLADEAFCARLLDEALRLAGPGGLDGLVNNAGIGLFTAVLGGTDPAEVQRCFAVNAAAPLRLAQLFAKDRVAQGRPGAIVNISSMSSSLVFPNHTAYSSSKAALDQITRHLAAELGPHQIRTNAVLPTVVRTEMGRTAWPDDAPETLGMLKKIPLRRFAEPEEIASVVAFLLDGSRSGMVNGALLPVDGGFLCYGGVV